MEVSSIELPTIQLRAVQKPLYPSREELTKIVEKFGIKVVCYIPGNKFEDGALSLKLPEGRDPEILIQEINKVLSPYRIVKTKFYEQDPFS